MDVIPFHLLLKTSLLPCCLHHWSFSVYFGASFYGTGFPHLFSDCRCLSICEQYGGLCSFHCTRQSVFPVLTARTAPDHPLPEAHPPLPPQHALWLTDKSAYCSAQVGQGGGTAQPRGSGPAPHPAAERNALASSRFLYPLASCSTLCRNLALHIPGAEVSFYFYSLYPCLAFLALETRPEFLVH